MNDRGCLIIDDVGAALARTTPLGERILRPGAEAVREVVLALAARRGWLVVDYTRFAEWAVELAMKSPHPWMVLDPLFPCERDPSRLRRLRVSRLLGSYGTGVDGPPLSFEVREGEGAIGVIDDAAASGRTLRLAFKTIAAAGCEAAGVAVCVATRSALAVIQSAAAGAKMDVYVPGDWRVTHLRDGCAYLPFSGRPIGAVELDGEATLMEARVAPRHAESSLWRVFDMDPAVCKATREAEAAVPSELAKQLGRSPEVRDLRLLGMDVPVALAPGRQANAEAFLSSLL